VSPFDEFVRCCREMKECYWLGRKGTRLRRKAIIRVEDAPERVVGTRSVWTRMVADAHARLLDGMTLEGLWHWRGVALALRRAGLKVFSGTTPVDRLWGNTESFFEKSLRRMTED